MKEPFVVVKIGNSQHIVSEGDNVEVNRISGKVGDKVEFDEVYLYQDKSKSEVGSPHTEYVVVAEITDQYRDKKIKVRKFRAKSRYRRNKGHRQHMTKLEIKEIKEAKASKSGEKSDRTEKKDSATKKYKKTEKTKKTTAKSKK